MNHFYGLLVSCSGLSQLEIDSWRKCNLWPPEGKTGRTDRQTLPILLSPCFAKATGSIMNHFYGLYVTLTEQIEIDSSEGNVTYDHLRGKPCICRAKMSRVPKRPFCPRRSNSSVISVYCTYTCCIHWGTLPVYVQCIHYQTTLEFGLGLLKKFLAWLRDTSQ